MNSAANPAKETDHLNMSPASVKAVGLVKPSQPHTTTASLLIRSFSFVAA
jgi:hypothetical protein